MADEHPSSVPEAPLVETDAGLKPEGEGWFVVNLAEAAAMATPDNGHFWMFEGAPRSFPHFGINVHVVGPGQASCQYHREEAQEAFLVLSGECDLIVEGQERRLRQWDFFYAAPWTGHVFVGAGEGPCAILMVGARNVGEGLVYPADEVAVRRGAGVERETPSPEEAYAGWERPAPARRTWPPR
jgi:uncharacterized cupin superfamily protein